MKYFSLLVSLFTVSQALNYDRTEWNNFKLSFNKVYKSLIEEEYRLKIFLENKALIADHNRKFDQGLVSYKKGINKFTDLTENEAVQRYTSKPIKLNEINSSLVFTGVKNMSLPDSIDWRTTGAITNVKDQGECHSGYAFAATGALEAYHFLKYGKLISLSEQNLIDCDTDLNQGCTLGLPNWAYLFVEKNGGIDSEESYPYEGNVGTCRYNVSGSAAKIRGYVLVHPYSEEVLQQALATMGPISLQIIVSNNFVSYSSGIFDDPHCDEYQDGRQELLAVGYGSENGKDYYIMKNSWGMSWGEQGYVRMVRNKDGQCGITSLPAYPLVIG